MAAARGRTLAAVAAAATARAALACLAGPRPALRQRSLRGAATLSFVATLSPAHSQPRLAAGRTPPRSERRVLSGGAPVVVSVPSMGDSITTATIATIAKKVRALAAVPARARVCAC